MTRFDDLSENAKALLDLYLAEYRPGLGGGRGAKSLSAIDSEQTEEAHDELVVAGYLTAAGSLATQSGPQSMYEMTEAAKKLKVKGQG